MSETPAQRRARLAEVFGDVLPETTRDERDPEEAGTAGTAGTAGEDGESPGDAWLRSQVPPHHG